MVLKIINGDITTADAVKQGLSGEKKSLPPWLFFNTKGSQLFSQIRKLPEYYITQCEQKLFETFAQAIAYNLSDVARSWNIIELNAADGTKSKRLIEQILRRKVNTYYFPVDVSLSYLRLLEENLAGLNDISITGIHSLYNKVLNDLPNGGMPRLILMLGDLIGNFEKDDAVLFLHSLSSQLNRNDQIIAGFDMMKSPSVIEKLHYDYTGMTTLFQKNVLSRINDEFKGDFNPDNFEYWPVYDAVSGVCRTYLVSTKKQTFHINAIDAEVEFKAWETISTGIHQKYTEEKIYKLASQANLQVERILYDDRKYYGMVFLKSRNL